MQAFPSSIKGETRASELPTTLLARWPYKGLLIGIFDGDPVDEELTSVARVMMATSELEASTQPGIARMFLSLRSALVQ